MSNERKAEAGFAEARGSASEEISRHARARGMAWQTWHAANEETQKKISGMTPEDIFALGWIAAMETQNGGADRQPPPNNQKS